MSSSSASGASRHTVPLGMLARQGVPGDCHLQKVGIVARVTFEPGRLTGPRAGVKDLDEHVRRWQARVRRSGDRLKRFEAWMPRTELIFPHVDDAEGPLVTS